MHDLVAETEVCQVMEDVWTSILGLGVTRNRAVPPIVPSSSYLGRVCITGAWEGAVLLRPSQKLARRATAILFGVEPDDATADEIRDALGELTNIIGGNIKSMLPGPSKLSIPFVQEGETEDAAHSFLTPLIEVVFDCEGQPLRVTVLTGNQGGTA